jgi:hypothetical protein
MYYCQCHRCASLAVPSSSSTLAVSPIMKNQDEWSIHFHQLSDDDLVRQCSSGRLSELAQSVAEAECLSRGLALPEMAPSMAGSDGDYHGDLTNVARFLEPTEAHLLKSYLESCAIPAFVADANLVQAIPFFGGASGTSLRVPAEFVPEALELIARFQQGGVLAADAAGDEAGGEISSIVAPAEDARLKTWRVYARPGQAVPIVVKVGFSWAAFIFGPLWFLVNYMWLNFAIVAALYLGGNLYFHSHRPETGMESLLFVGMYAFYIVLWILIAKFANSLLAGELEDRGYRLLATVKARNSTYARDAAVKLSASPAP